MPDDMTFMMGKFPAMLPGDLRYAVRNHMWCRAVGRISQSVLPPDGLGNPSPTDGRFRFGFTSYAIRLMQDVYFLDWQVSTGDNLQQLQQIGHIETSKAVADLFAPVSGTIVAFNQELLNDPTPINLENYGAGWLFEMRGDAGSTTLTRRASEGQLCSVTEYYQFLEANWEKTQRTLKGHM